MPKIKKKYILFWLAGLGLAAIFIWLAIFAKAQARNLVVHFFDIGQGKAIFIELPDGNQILIDGGPNNSVIEKLSGVMPFFDREIDLVILTHPDSDHLNGLIDVLKRYEIGRIIETGIVDKSAEYQEWQKIIKEKNTPVTFAFGGQKIKIGDGFLFEILYPNRSLAGESTSNINSTSIVIRLNYGQNSFLFTGDEEGAAESYLVGSGANIDVNILDVSHHGSKNSTSEEFVAKVTPEIAVIQAGKNNRYGHPAPETLERLKGTMILRTDQCGDVSVLSDGEKYQIKSGC